MLKGNTMNNWPDTNEFNVLPQNDIPPPEFLLPLMMRYNLRLNPQNQSQLDRITRRVQRNGSFTPEQL